MCQEWELLLEVAEVEEGEEEEGEDTEEVMTQAYVQLSLSSKLFDTALILTLFIFLEYSIRGIHRIAVHQGEEGDTEAEVHRIRQNKSVLLEDGEINIAVSRSQPFFLYNQKLLRIT